MSDKTGKIHHSEKRFGVVAVQKGFITPDQLLGALKDQVQDDLEERTPRLVGEILHQQGAMTWTQIGEVLATLRVITNIHGP